MTNKAAIKAIEKLCYQCEALHIRMRSAQANERSAEHLMNAKNELLCALREIDLAPSGK